MIGGTSIFGGRGGYAGTIVGALILTVLTTLLTVLQMPEGSRRILFGADHPAGHRRLPPHRRGSLSVEIRPRGTDASALELCSDGASRRLPRGRPRMNDEVGPVTKAEERRAFLLLAVVLAPVLSVAIVGGYGFMVWMSQLVLGPPTG